MKQTFEIYLAEKYRPATKPAYNNYYLPKDCDYPVLHIDQIKIKYNNIATPVKETEPEQPYYKGKGLEDGGFTKGEWKVVKLGESPKVKEWAAVANVQYGGGDSDFVILAPVNTATLLHMEAKANAELIVKAVNNFPAMVEIIKQVKFWFDNESTYPPFTGGYRIAQQAKAILTRINKD